MVHPTDFDDELASQIDQCFIEWDRDWKCNITWVVATQIYIFFHHYLRKYEEMIKFLLFFSNGLKPPPSYIQGTMSKRLNGLSSMAKRPAIVPCCLSFTGHQRET